MIVEIIELFALNFYLSIPILLAFSIYLLFYYRKKGHKKINILIRIIIVIVTINIFSLIIWINWFFEIDIMQFQFINLPTLLVVILTIAYLFIINKINLNKKRI